MYDWTPRQFLEEELPRRFSSNPMLLRQFSGVLVLEIAGAEGGRWAIDPAKPHELVTRDTRPTNPIITIQVADHDFVALTKGEMSVCAALERERLRYFPENPELRSAITLLFTDDGDGGLQELERLNVLSLMNRDTAAFVPRRFLEKTLFYYEQLKLLKDVPGDIVEFGTYRGTFLCILNDLASIVDAPSPFRAIIGFDTFCGFPESNKMESGPPTDRGHFAHRLASDTSLQLVRRKLEERPDHRIQLVAGDIFETLPRKLAKWPNKIALAICDLDVASVTEFVLQQIWERMSPGGLICFDEYSRNGWSETTGVDKFLKERGLSLSLLKKGPRCPSAYLRV